MVENSSILYSCKLDMLSTGSSFFGKMDNSNIARRVNIAIGGFFFFRKMTHKELFCSASVLVVLNIVFGLIAYKMQGMFSFYFAELTEWDSLISSLLFQVTQNVWISAVINWILPPYIFVLFGKKASNES